MVKVVDKVFVLIKMKCIIIIFKSGSKRLWFTDSQSNLINNSYKSTIFEWISFENDGQQLPAVLDFFLWFNNKS
jgi:hypothetical protein